MGLSSDLIMQFVKATKAKDEPKKETTVYGTIVESNSLQYVQLDGSELLTPISKTSDIRDGDRVTVLIKNHTAVVTGNLTSPSARVAELEEVGGEVGVVKQLVADKVDVGIVNAQTAQINGLVANNAVVNNTLLAYQADIDTLSASKLDAHTASLTYATIVDLNAANADIDTLAANFGEFEALTTYRLDAVYSKIENLEAGNFDAVYANIDFSNIGKAAMEYFYAQSGLIDNVVVGDQTITGELVGVTISGDRLIGNTVIAEKLVIRGSDGLYYKLNTDGMTVETNQTDENSLNGQIIKAKSITATKISVSDLVAFGATIGGFHIGQNSLYSGVKSAVGNTTRGIFLGSDGQIAIGDASNFLKYYKDTDGNYKLDISAKSLSISSGTDVETAISDLQKIEIGGRNLLLNSDLETNFRDGIQTFALSDYAVKNIKNRQVSVSFDARTSEAGTGFDLYLRSAPVNGTADAASNIIPINSLTTAYKRYSVVITSNDLDAITLAMRSTKATTGKVSSQTATFYVKNIKVEFGNKPSDWTAAPEDLIVGSRNYALNSAAERHITTSYYQLYNVSEAITNLQSSCAIISFDAKKVTGSKSVNMYAYLRSSSGVVCQSEKLGDITDEYVRYSCPIWCPEDLSEVTSVAVNTNVSTGDVYIKNVKLERGTKTTDWTPAPEDVDSDISEAAKTATNYMSFDSTSGLQVGNKRSGSWSGFRTQITNAAFNILNSAGTVLASYGEKLIELGKNATDAVIKLCGGKGRIEYTTEDDSGGEYLQVSADKLRLKSSEMSSLYSMYTDDETYWRKSAANVSPDNILVYASECVDPLLVDKLEGWRESGISVTPDSIEMATSGDVSIMAVGEYNMSNVAVSPLSIYMYSSDNIHLETANDAGMSYIDMTPGSAMCFYSDGCGYMFDGGLHDDFSQFESVYNGKSGIWTYRKWLNGEVDLVGVYSITNMDCTTALGNMYRTAVFTPNSFPFTVYDPKVTASYESQGYGAFLWATTNTSQTNPPSYYLVRPTSATIANGRIIFHVRGRWKT